jgi:Mrp family chromosome partitioning ATPase
VELNAFKPDHRYHGTTEQGLGIVDVLVGKATLADVIVPGNTLFPDRIPVGDTQGSRHLSTGKNFLTILDELHKHYDILLLDTPPILLSADAELLTGIADAAFLVIGAEAVSTGEVRRAARLLERLAPSVVGFIVNRVQVFGAGGYFADLLKEYETGEKLEPTGLLARWFRPAQRKRATRVHTAQWEPVRDGAHGAGDDRRDEQYL